MSPQAQPHTTASIPLRIGTVDLRTRQLRGAGGLVVVLTSREVDLLARLASAPGEVVSAEDLLEAVWGRRWTGEPTELGVVRNSVFKLRQKVERNLAAPEHILTVQGEGYRFVPLVGSPEPAPLAHPPPPAPPPLRALPSARVSPPDPSEPWDPAWDVGRVEEAARARQALDRPARPLLITAPWRAGKSWFLRRLLSALEPGDAVARLDPRAMPPETLADPAELIGFLALLIGDALGLPEDEVERALVGRGPAAWRFRRWMEHTALPSASGRLILAFEDLDRLARAPVFGELLALLRSQAEEERPVWGRLRVVTTSRTSVARLTSGLASSPFNLGQSVPLPPLGAAELGLLCARAGLPARPEALERATLATGGHPWLLRLLLSEAARAGAPLDDPGLQERALAPAAADLSVILRQRAELLPALALALDAADQPVAPADVDTLIELGLILGSRPPYRAAAPALLRLLR